MTESAIRIERSQRDAAKPPWWWILGDTYHHRVLLKQQGARFSGKRRAWYFVGWELPPPIRQLTGDVTPIESAPEETEEALEPAPVMSPELERQILDTLAQDDTEHSSGSPLAVASPPQEKVEAEKPVEDQKPPTIRVTKSVPIPVDGEPLTAIQAAIRDTHSLPLSNTAAPVSTGQIERIGQSYCGELTGSISGQVFSYGWAVHEGVCVYLNMAGPRVAVEAIRAKLSKGDQVSVVPPDAPTIELTAGEGNTGMYHAYLHYLPEARFASLILVHEWSVTPNYGGKSTTFIFRTSEAQAMAKLKQHVTQLVNIPVFDGWSAYLYEVGQRAMLVSKARAAGGIDLLSVDLDVDAWTQLISGGLEQRLVQLPS